MGHTSVSVGSAQRLLLGLGQSYSTDGRNLESRAQLEMAVDVTPASVELYVALGSFHQARGDSKQAEGLYGQAIAVAPGGGSDPVGLQGGWASRRLEQQLVQSVGTWPCSA
jgi:Tfp pilus assembly protein PilF